MPSRLLALTAVGAVAALVASPVHAAEPVTAILETPALWSEDDADADDPAIWVNEADPADSLVITTAKEAGLYVYDLQGNELQHVDPRPAPGDDDAPGRYNNVDLIEDFKLDGERVDLAVASDRGMDDLGVFKIEDGLLVDVTDEDAGTIFTDSQEEINGEHTAYGLTTFQNRNGAYALVSRNSETEVALLKLKAEGDKVTWTKVRTLSLPASFELPNGDDWTTCDDPGQYAQVEGMAVDEATGTAYLGQELVGIWKIGTDLKGEPELVDTAVEFGVPGTYNPETDECDYGPDPGYGGDVLRTDIEGLTIYSTGRGTGYLLASSQGDNTYAVYDLRGSNEYLGSFAVSSGAVDSTQHSDGADVVNVSLPGYPGGLLVVQDGDNTPEGTDESSTNFKYLAWQDVADNLDLRTNCTRR